MAFNVSAAVMRASAVASVVLTLVALWLPIYVIEWDRDPSVHYTYSGIDAALFGWAATISLISFAWLANAPWMWSLARMVRGKPPNWIAAVIAPALATTAFQPLPAFQLDDQANGYGEPLQGIAVWIIAQAIPLLVLIGLSVARPADNPKP